MNLRPNLPPILGRPAPAIAGLLLAVCAHAAPAPPAADSAVRVLGRVSAHYRSLDRYDISGHSHVEIGNHDQTSNIEVPMRFAAAAGRRYADVENPNFSTLTVLREDSVWIATPKARLYNVAPAAEARLRASVDPQFAKMLDPLSDYTTLDRHLRSARIVGRDTVRLTEGIVRSLRIEAAYEPDTSRHDVEEWPRTFWIEADGARVLRDSIRADVMHPQLGQLTTIQVTRYVTWHDDVSPDDPLFTFVPPAGTQRAMPPPPPPAFALKGKPAPDFTLPRLASAKSTRAPAPVKLSALRGKVVLLDFWATWCGPCRRWMPIVGKVHESLKSKGLVTYAVNMREEDAKVAAFVRQTNVVAPVLLDREGTVGTRYEAGSIPLTVIIGRDGIVAEVLLGLHDETQLREALHKAGLD